METNHSTADAPKPQFPQRVVAFYAGMAEITFGIPHFIWDSGDDAVLCALWLEHWRGLLAVGAHMHEPIASLVAPGASRAELVRAMREGSDLDLLHAFDAAKAGGIPEVQAQFEALRRLTAFN